MYVEGCMTTYVHTIHCVPVADQHKHMVWDFSPKVLAKCASYICT